MNSRWLGRAVVGAGLLGGSWMALQQPAAQRLDVRLGEGLREAGNAAADRIVGASTDLGSLYAVGGIAAVLAGTGRGQAAVDVLGVGLLAWTGAQASKRWVRRQRPYEADGARRLVRPPAGSSFPSGHAAVAAAVMTVLGDGLPSRRRRRLLDGLAAYVSASRVYVGVHYPTDAAGGAGLGLLVGAAWRGPFAVVGRALTRGGARVALGFPRGGRGAPRRRRATSPRPGSPG